ncbi:helix-turn-helix domain-containing protein [Seleniivibrio sp.]|uniref:helix-turn-helix domain-containing protein n=1 Tax=Seleniivibrio sp. TaxID=2898801 RepID=UPI0025F8A170|nr:helix-turn-helix domain-containing protein [Seleniivibrio sp.]MCD8553326.1 helix-turn-helix domain-containing protein [Seleniivibrio sp.]
MSAPSYREFKPAPHLQPFIAAYWLSEGYYAEKVLFPIFADGCCDIIFDIAANSPAKMVGTGVNLEYVPLKGKVRLGGIRFLPGGFTALTGIPADRIYDGTDAEDMLNSKIVEGLKRINDGFSPSALDAVFGSCVSCRNPMMSFWLSSQDSDVKGIASYFGCSVKTVSRTFLHHTGATPSKMLSVKRFQHSLKMVVRGGSNYTEIAYEAGYYDQSHFIKDFKKYSGSTPSDFLRYKNSLGVRFIQFPTGCI